MFIMGCPNMIVVEDHQPLMGVFADRVLCEIYKLKEKSLTYFSIACVNDIGILMLFLTIHFLW